MEAFNDNWLLSCHVLLVLSSMPYVEITNHAQSFDDEMSIFFKLS